MSHVFEIIFNIKDFHAKNTLTVICSDFLDYLLIAGGAIDM